MNIKTARKEFADILHEVKNRLDEPGCPPPIKRRKTPTEVQPSNDKLKTPIFTLKLFDKSVNLAQFCNTDIYVEDAPLYSVCRAWVRNDLSTQRLERPEKEYDTQEQPEVKSFKPIKKKKKVSVDDIIAKKNLPLWSTS